MHYLLLTEILNSLVESFTCGDCEAPITAESLHILDISRENNLHLGVICPQCGTKHEIRAQTHNLMVQMSPGEAPSLFAGLTGQGVTLTPADTGAVSHEKQDVSTFFRQFDRPLTCEDLFS